MRLPKSTPTPKTLLPLLLLLLSTTQPALATPLPAFTDIERRWSAGETDATIHALQNPRAATPAWPLARPYTSSDDEPGSFAAALDARTQKRSAAASGGSGNRGTGGRGDPAVWARIRDFAARLMRSKGVGGEFGEGMGGKEEEVRVLRRAGRVRYRVGA